MTKQRTNIPLEKVTEIRNRATPLRADLPDELRGTPATISLVTDSGPCALRPALAASALVSTST